MSRRRKRWNAICSQLSRAGGLPELPEREAKCPEQIIVEIVTQECERYGVANGDDMASDLILKVWQEGKFLEDFDHLRMYVRSCLRFAYAKYMARTEIPFSDMMPDDRPDDNYMDSLSFMGKVQAGQHAHIEALEAISFAEALPVDQRDSLFILGGGGNPLDVAADMGLEPWEAIRLIREARANIHRVDRLD